MRPVERPKTRRSARSIVKPIRCSTSRSNTGISSRDRRGLGATAPGLSFAGVRLDRIIKADALNMI